MKRSTRSRWKLVGYCVAATLAWEYLYSTVLDSEGRLTTYLANTAPLWLQRIHRWSPSFLSVRILNLVGWRFDVAYYDENTAFVLISWAIEAVIWAAVLFTIASWIGRRLEKSHELAAS